MDYNKINMTEGVNSQSYIFLYQEIKNLQEKLIEAKNEIERSEIVDEILKIKEMLRKNGY